MSEPKYPDVKVQLSGKDGNIFFIVGRVCRALRDARVPSSEIELFTETVSSATSYDDALQCVMNWVNVA